MKTKLAAITISAMLCSCVTETETRPDGSMSSLRRVDPAVMSAGVIISSHYLTHKIYHEK
jgi:hypothetical protein